MKQLLFLPFLAAPIAFFSCEVHSKEAVETQSGFCIPDSLMTNITFDTVRSELVMSDLKLSGKISFNEDKVAKVFPLVSGHVDQVKVSLGDYVQKGQLLATVRSTDMANYYNDYKSAESELQVAKKNMEVTADMRNSGVSSEKDLLTAQSDYHKAVAQFNKVNEVLKIYGSRPNANDAAGSEYNIRAPASGFIVEKNVNTGMELRTDNSTNLFTISDMKEVLAIANVYETDIAKIRQGSAAEISTLSYPDKKFSGNVEKISTIVNPETNVMSVKIRLNNPDYTLKPGMFANISILFPGTEKKVVVPSRAVLFDDGSQYVVLFKKICDVNMQPVTVYKTVDGKTYLDGHVLEEGDLLIDRNALFVFTALKKL